MDVYIEVVRVVAGLRMEDILRWGFNLQRPL